MRLLTLAPLLAVASAFADTASFYSSVKLGSEFNYITDVNVLSKAVNDYTSKLCQSEDQLKIYRVDSSFKNANKGTYIKHVHYSNADELDLQFAENCIVGSSILYVDIDNKELQEVLAHESGAYFVQGKPTFGGSRYESVKNYIEDTLNFEKKKRFDIEESSEEQLIKEVEQDFRDVESFIELEVDDNDVEEHVTETEPISKVPLGLHASGLFTKYQFFTPGLWLCIIVSLILVSILYTALGWITSLEISYQSFEKQVDFEKKRE